MLKVSLVLQAAHDNARSDSNICCELFYRCLPERFPSDKYEPIIRRNKRISGKIVRIIFHLYRFPGFLLRIRLLRPGGHAKQHAQAHEIN